MTGILITLLCVSGCGLIGMGIWVDGLQRRLKRADNRIDTLLRLVDRAQADAESADSLTVEVCKEFRRRSGDDIFPDNTMRDDE